MAIVQNNIDSRIIEIKKSHRNTINKYHFPVDQLIKKIYPEFCKIAL